MQQSHCSLLVGAGRSDQLVTADAAQPLSQLTSSQDVTFTLIPGGHLGYVKPSKCAGILAKASNMAGERSTKF